MEQKRFLSKGKLLTLGLCALALVVIIRWFWPTPLFNDGDIIFQTSRSGQSKAIMLASRSLYSHMGIVKHTAKGWVVVEAVGPVKETPLKVWVNRGWQRRVAVYRYAHLSADQKDKLFTSATQLYGRPYDLYFSFDNNSIYCSELVFLAFKAAGIKVGKAQSLGSLGTDLGFAKSLMDQRAQSDPQCRDKGLKGEACLSLVRQRLLVTPKSIAQDKALKRIYSNYPL